MLDKKKCFCSCWEKERFLLYLNLAISSGTTKDNFCKKKSSRTISEICKALLFCLSELTEFRTRFKMERNGWVSHLTVEEKDFTFNLIWEKHSIFWSWNWVIIPSAGVHNSNLMAGQKNFFDISKGQSWYVLTHSKGVFTQKRSKINKIWGFAGQIKSFCGPHLAHGPYVVHAWPSVLQYALNVVLILGMTNWFIIAHEQTLITLK